MAVWMKHLFLNERINEKVFEEIQSMTNEKEAKSMLVNTIEELKKDWFEDGVQQGMQQGMQQGKEMQALESAKKMKELGVSSDIISRSTGLSEEQIEGL